MSSLPHKQSSTRVADSSTLSSKTMKRKRKSYQYESPSRPSKAATRQKVCSGEGEEEEDHGLQWRNLELSLAIESNKEGTAIEKVELAHNYLKSVTDEKKHDVDQALESGSVPLPRLIIRLNGWIQSLLISTEHKIRTKDKMLRPEDSELCLDCRCWEILRYCLQESAELGFSLNLSGNLLRVIGFATRNAVNFPSEMESERFKLYRVVYDCIRSMFSFHNAALKGSMDVWMAAVGSVLELVTEVFAKKVENSVTGSFFIDLSCSILEPFCKFLRVHRWRKNGFQDFVNNLVEPLFHLLGLLHDETRNNDIQNLSNLIEQTISYGLFHPSHMDEFLHLQGLEKYSSPSVEQSREVKTEIRSYHRHLFEKLHALVSQKKDRALGGSGELFQLFVKQVKSQNRELFEIEGLRQREGKSSNHTSHVPPPQSVATSENTNKSKAILRKAVFDFLVQIMEPLLHEINTYVQYDAGIGPSPLNAKSILRSLNKMLYSIICEKVYVRTEDISEGACVKFLKVIYDLIISFSARVIGLLLSSCDSIGMEQLPLIAEELVVAVGYILEIEHKVIGEGLVDLWLLILAFLAAGQRLSEKSEVQPLISRTVELSCQAVNLFKELREASHAVFALCRGLRHLLVSASEAESTFSAIMSVSMRHNEMISMSAELLMRSWKFRMNIHKALQSIPEGQASDCIHTLIDISKSLDWTEFGFSTSMEMECVEGNSHKFIVHPELLGKVFSEIYVLVLDSIPVTAGNSSNIGDALNRLFTFMQPVTTCLIASAQCKNDGLVTSLMRSTSRTNILDTCHWSLLFFFRLYVSFRSLFRKTISLLPPRSSLKKSVAMGDGFTAYSGMDLTRSDGFSKIGCISYLFQSSTSLLSVIQAIGQNIDEASSADYAPLVYMMHSMVVQRLVDLNRQLNFVQYLLQENSRKVLADDGLAQSDKKDKNWKLNLSDLKKEALTLTAFMMKLLSSVDMEEFHIARSGEQTSKGSSQPLIYSWDMSVCSIDKKTLPTAVWWLICQNVAVWCNHATEEDLQLFLSVVISSAICNGCPSQETLSSCTAISSNVMNFTVQRISVDLLQDASFYELTFVHRYLAPNICHALLKFKSLPEWVRVLSTLEISYIDEAKGTFSFLENGMIEEFFKGGGMFPLTSFHFTICQNLLNLLIYIPKRSLSNDSFLHCTRFVLNLERVIVRSLRETNGSSQLHGQYELLRLLVSSRRALKCLIVAFSEGKNKANESSGVLPFGESPSHVLWLLKSAASVVERVSDCSKSGDVQTSSMIFSLIDQTSGVITVLAKFTYNISVQLHKSGLNCKRSAATRNSIGGVQACRTINMMAKILRNQLNDTAKSESTGNSFRLIKLNKMSSLLSCIQGFLRGLSATLNDINAGECVLYVKGSGGCENISKINRCIVKSLGFMDSILKKFVINEGHTIENICDADGLVEVDSDRNISEQLDFDTGKVLLALPEFGSASGGIWKNLQGFLGHQSIDSLFFIRELFVTSVAILRLRIRIKCSPLPSSLLKFLLGILQETLLEFAKMDQVPKGFWFVLDGALQFLEELGYQYGSNYLTMTRDVLVKLVRLHFKAIGKCISLQQKIAKLAFHEMESGAGTLSPQWEGIPVLGMEELKARLRLSFKMLIKNSSHLESAVQALERTLAGVHEGCPVIYEISIGKDDGGVVSSTVAAGIDCLDLVLECVEGRQPVKEKLQGLTASLFNIILHLQGSSIFNRNIIRSEKDNPDPGLVVLMCVEVLTRISRKDTLFKIDAGHHKNQQQIDVGQFLRLPAALFNDFCHLIDQNRFPAPNSWTSPTANSDVHLGDQQFSIDLYAACCRLLCTAVKHRHSECVKKTGLLQYSVDGLLNCLEMAGTDSLDRNGYFTWTLEEGIKCACNLRRVYEEIRQQKVFKEHCLKFLSSYISIFSGFGPSRKGLKREIDEAMRPGVYALIDACSEQNLQCLHTEFGEGPCRSYLASLRHDYKLHFQYHGKV